MKTPAIDRPQLARTLLKTSLLIGPLVASRVIGAHAVPQALSLSSDGAVQREPEAFHALSPGHLLPWGIVLGLSGILLARRYKENAHSSASRPRVEGTGVSKAIADALKEAKEAAELANRSKDEFLAALSHELRSPLNPVLLLASEYARSSGLPQRLREDFQIILHNVRLQARLIDDLLDLNRIQRGGLSISARRLYLKKLLGDVCKGLQTEALEREVTLELQCPEEECVIRGDSTRLHQIFGNVLRNAIKFAPFGTPVRMCLEIRPCLARVSVSDTGPGIHPEDLERIFSPFVQAPRAGGAASSCGLGLGLAIAQRLVERHRGRIWAESDGTGKGAHFHIELPLEPLDPLGSHTPEPDISAPAQRGASQILRVLLLEDHDSTRTILCRMLQRQGIDTLHAATIDAASQILATQPVDILISDLSLPDGEGFGLPHLWRSQIRLGSIALSGFGMEHDIARSRDCGFARHLTKPVEFGTLLDAIEYLSSAGDKHAAPIR